MASAAKFQCPVCNAKGAEEFRPFCSGRCAELDLGRWLKGTYAIPTEETPDEHSNVFSESDGEDRFN